MAEQQIAHEVTERAEERPSAVEPPPTVVCDDLHVVYRIVGQTGAGSAATALRRLLGRQSSSTVFKRVHAVRGISLVAREGDAIALIGRNGSGKSTLLRAIAGLLPAEDGHVYTSGRPTLLGVNAALMKELSGEENILLGCMAMGMTRQEARARRDWIAAFADLGDDFLTLPMTAYSSGMAARLRFAIAASMSHEILMIDEALATGDAEFRRRSEQRIMELREEAGTVFLVSHSLGVVRLTCNRAIWLEKGKIVMDGEANEVVDAYEAVYDPEQEALERKRLRAKKRRDRRAAEDAARKAAEAARAARAARGESEFESGDGPSDGQPTPDQPAPAQPAPTQPDPTQPDPTAPDRTESASTQPAFTQPDPTAPDRTKSASTQPASTQPASTQPASTQPASTQPAFTQPAPTEPGTRAP